MQCNRNNSRNEEEIVIEKNEGMKVQRRMRYKVVKLNVCCAAYHSCYAEMYNLSVCMNFGYFMHLTALDH
jgi:hypothetical protein